jgi:molybdopterin synthase catalytic subunit
MTDSRYSRQVLQWGDDNQRRLAAATILVAGVGGLGTTVCQLLARAGVGQLILVDDGVVDWPDLHRQTLYDEEDVGRRKVAVAQEKLTRINSGVEVVTLDQRIADGFMVPAAVTAVADCLDNFAGRFALYRGLQDGQFFVHGGVQGESGQVLSLVKGESQPLDEIFAGSRQPAGTIPVTPDSVTIIAGLICRELFNGLFGTPQLRDRILVVDLADLHLSFMDV